MTTPPAPIVAVTVRASTVAQALSQARTLGLDRLDAHLLLAETLQRPRSWLLAHDDAPLPAAQAAQYQHWLARRAGGEPLAYIVGHQEFHGLRLEVTPAVLVPRPETETLVDWGLELLGRWALETTPQTLPQTPPPPAAPVPSRHPLTQAPRVIDLGTGSGAIALAIRHRHPAACVSALDASPAALSVAQRNAQQLSLSVRWPHSHWWQAVTGERFHLALSNPPYIAGDDHHLAALTHEPRLALTPEGDGLAALREIVAQAPSHLEPGGWLLLEHGYDQAEPVQALLAQHGFLAIETRTDLAGLPRCTGGQRP